jgi:hypothetical protein
LCNILKTRILFILLSEEFKSYLKINLRSRSSYWTFLLLHLFFNVIAVIFFILPVWFLSFEIVCWRSWLQKCILVIIHLFNFNYRLILMILRSVNWFSRLHFILFWWKIHLILVFLILFILIELLDRFDIFNGLLFLF